MEQNEPATTEAPKAVFPNELDIVLAIVENYKKQIEEALQKTDDALTKIKENLKLAEQQKIAVMAQKNLAEALDRDFKKQLAQR